MEKRSLSISDRVCDSAHESHDAENEARDVSGSVTAHQSAPTTEKGWTPTNTCKISEQQDDANVGRNESALRVSTGSRQATSGVSLLGPDHSGDLCSECRSLALYLGQLRPNPVLEGLPFLTSFTRRVEREPTAQTAACPVCKLVLSIQPRGYKPDRLELIARSPESAIGFAIEQHQGTRIDVFLAAVPKGPNWCESFAAGFIAVSGGPDAGLQPRCLALHDQPTVAGPQLTQIGPYVDWGRIGSFVKFCRERHADRDDIHVPTALRDLPLLRVIDCQHTPLVVLPAPAGCSYIALSYVWGNHTARKGSSTHSNDLADGEIPQVIVDAVGVVRRLGFRYLWVDQYVSDLLLELLSLVNGTTCNRKTGGALIHCVQVLHSARQCRRQACPDPQHGCHLPQGFPYHHSRRWC
ncbi:hypothetical protein B0T19DRAFT_243593 [Cercophora scortea]|uniref:Heterokaryon incompatibility domain-containing protein n=1 Tax=Cercophora scortea TaxID=314031 RepID=A0AAE0I8K3_9PEZI|nr:hypothetical protein B0T19DRAFT_243593 [Cercophora scortea]